MKYLLGLILCMMSVTLLGQTKLTLDDVYVEKEYEVTQRYDDGSIAEIGQRHWWTKKRHGDWYRFDRDGKLIQEAHFKRDRKHGIWRAWASNGTLVARYEFDMNKRVGDWFYFNHETSELLTYHTY